MSCHSPFIVRIRATFFFGLASTFVLTCFMPGIAGEAPVADSATKQMTATVQDKTLAADLKKAMDKARNSPKREPMQWLATNKWVQNLFDLMSGKKMGSPQEFNSARRLFKERLKMLSGPDWPTPKAIQIPRLKTPPVIDGVLDDPGWKKAFHTNKIYAFSKREPSAEPKTDFYVAWDEKYLYFAFSCSDRNIQAPPIQRDGHVYFNDCVEMFILSDKRIGVYWEIVVNPAGSLFDCLHAKRFHGWGSEARREENIAGLQLKIKMDGTPNQPKDQDRGYTVEVAVPFKELPGYMRGNPPRPGETVNLMLARFNKKGRKLNTYAWVPLLSWGHNIWNYVPATLAP